MLDPGAFKRNIGYNFPLSEFFKQKKASGIMQIRRITSADDAAVASIVKASLKQAGLALPGTAYFDPELAHLSAYYAQTAFRDYYVLTNGQEVVGGAGFAEYDLDRKICELQKVYLSAAVRGHGLSYQLLTFVEQMAKQAGYQQMYLETHSSLAAAIHVYKKLGFEQLDQPLSTTNHSLMDVLMIKQL